MACFPEFRRVGAYAIIIRDDKILLSRLARRIVRDELWTLPGGGVDHGEDPTKGVVREVEEETGLRAHIDPRARVYSGHYPAMRRDGKKWDYQALRIVYEGWVAPDSPEPRVVEVDGSTVEARWVPIDDLLAEKVTLVPWVAEVLADYEPARRQRIAAYARIVRDDSILLTRLSERGVFPGSWTLPGGGVDHGEPPAVSLAREIGEECGVTAVVGRLLDVHDAQYRANAPTGRFEDFHGIHLLFEASVPPEAEPCVVEQHGTTDAVAWLPIAEVRDGRVEALDVVRHALELEV